jgi:hypothetical protein
MKHKVFISHSSKDKTIGDEVCRFLEANGIPCWIAPRDVTPGKNYGAAIVDAIDECPVFVLILSSESNKSGQVVREVERAASSDSVIIPLRVEPVELSRNLEFYVSASHWLDATEKPLAKHLGHLLEAIKNWEGGGETKQEQILSAPAIAPRTSGRSQRRLLVTPVIIPVAGAVLCLLVLYFIARNPPPVKVGPQPSTTPALQPTSPTTQAPPSPGLYPRTLFPHASAPPPIIQQITASSVLEPESHRGEVRHYEANLAFDSDETTAWVPKEGGIGQWIMVNFKSPSSITSISVFGGYGVDARRYESNNRPRAVRVTFSSGNSETLRLEDKMKLQHFELPRPVLTDSVKIEIIAVYRSERHDSTAISEIIFNRDTD